MLLPFSISNAEKDQGAKLVLAGDVGGTKTNLGLFKVAAYTISPVREARFVTRDYNGIVEMLDAFLKDVARPDAVCLGVAGPVLNGHVKLSNINWEIDSVEIGNRLGIENVNIINDLEAAGYGLAVLKPEDISVLRTGDDNAIGNVAIISPGTGLGEAGLYWDGKSYHPFATEGGHCDFAARDHPDFELYSYLQKRFGHVSWERLVCGPGIFNIYQFLRDEKKKEEPLWLKDELSKGDPPVVISKHRLESGICSETMHLFVKYLAYESANVVLKFKATGGLYIGGGIVPQILPLPGEDLFFTSFCQSGRLNYMLEKVPVKVILNSKASLLGAAFYGSQK